MSYPFHEQNLPSHQPRKSVFKTDKKEQNVNCNFLDLFQHKGILICTEERKLEQLSPIQRRRQQEMTATKLSKKSLKSHHKFNEFIQITVKKEKTNINSFQTKTEKTVQNLGHGLTRQASKVFSKTTSSELGYNGIRKPAACYSQISKMGNHSYKCSSENIINSFFQKGPLSQSCNLEKQRLSNISMVQSMSKNSVEGLSGMRQSKQMRPLMNPEAFNFQKVKFVNSISQSLYMLGISPVKQIIIPQVSQRSGLNSHYPTQRQELTISQKMQFKAPPEIRKITSEEYSQFLRTTPNKTIEGSIKYSFPLETVQQHKKPSIMAYDQSKVEFQVEEGNFLENSFQKEEQQLTYNPNEKPLIGNENRYEFNQGGKVKYDSPYQGSQVYDEQIRSSQVNNSKIHCASSKVFSASGKQIHALQQIICQAQQEPHSRQVFNEVSQSQIESDKEESLEQESQVEQKKQTTKVKAPKLQHIPFARHLVDIPRSKKLSGMTVRRTVSMRDKEQSQQQETSQVIYGFRKTHKEAIMEDINEDMHESCVTRAQHNFNNNINLSDFRQLLM